MLIYQCRVKQLGVSKLGWSLAVTVKHLAAADHQPDLVDVHNLFLDLAAALHLGHLLEVGGCLDVLRSRGGVDDGEGSDGALHPDGHRLEAYQFPVVEAFDPACEVLVDLALWSVESGRWCDLHVELLHEVVDQGLGESLVLLHEGVVMEEQGIRLQVLVDGKFEVLGQVAFNVSVNCSPAECKNRHFSSLEVLLLPVELAAQQKCERWRWHCQDIAIWRFDGLPVERDEEPTQFSQLLVHGMFFDGVGFEMRLLVEPLHVVLLVADLGADSRTVFQHHSHHHYNLGLQQGMNYLRGLLSPRSLKINQDRVESMFVKMRLYGSVALHGEYYRILVLGLQSAEDEVKCIKTVISKLDSLQEIEEIVKLFTVLHRLLIQKNYSGGIIDCLQNAEMAAGRSFSFSMQEYGWFVPFYRTYIFYLAKLSSNADILIKAALETPKIQRQLYLNHFFRILNQLTIILLPFNNTIKTVGRYYKQLKVFQEFYRVVQQELVNVYNYLRVLIEGIVRDYEGMSVEELETFVQATPDYELMVDQLEELLMSKYFHRGKKLQQPYIRAEDIAKINYDIECRKKAIGLKSPRK